ncbi:MAG: c-type cytochrome [Nitrospinales bacterium]
MSELASKGEKTFLHYCAHCHGISGDGDGFNYDYLDKEPAELSDHKFIAKKTNAQLFRIIKLGGIGVKKSPLMPVFGNTLSEEQIWQLIAYIRYLGRDDAQAVRVPDDASESAPETTKINFEMITSFSKWYSANGSNQEFIDLGEQLFYKKKSCFACHQLDDEGGRVGPELTRAGFLYTPEWIYTWIRNPQFIKPNTKMPNIGLVEEEDRAITTFLSSLPGESIDIPEEWAIYSKDKGDPDKGQELFFDPEGIAYCGKCHSVKGEGGKVGPNLSYIGSMRTLPFLIESILDPKAVITAGYSSILILTNDGEFLTGIKRNEDSSSIDIITKDGEAMHVSKDIVKKYKTQKISIMPGNFKDILTVDDIKNILAYLKTLTLPQMQANTNNP